MEFVKIEFKCQILRIINEGFNAILEDNTYLIKFRDNKINYPFKANDKLNISVENVEKARSDLITKDSILIYVVISSFINNGFLFKDVRENSGFFWRNLRGMLTYKMFENQDVWEKDALLKIQISKI